MRRKPLIYKMFISYQCAITWHHCREAGYSARGQGRDRGATETYKAEKLRVVADAAGEPAVPALSKPDPRLVNLIQLLARQAARNFVQAETDSRKRDRLPE
jgi:hypothetical protein